MKDSFLFRHFKLDLIAVIYDLDLGLACEWHFRYYASTDISCFFILISFGCEILYVGSVFWYTEYPEATLYFLHHRCRTADKELRMLKIEISVLAEQLQCHVFHHIACISCPPCFLLIQYVNYF